MKLVYPIILYPMEEHEGGYTVEVPDLPGCVTEGHDLADALDMARRGEWLDPRRDGGRARRAAATASPSTMSYCALPRLTRTCHLLNQLSSSLPLTQNIKTALHMGRF